VALGRESTRLRTQSTVFDIFWWTVWREGEDVYVHEEPMC
jgi:hypothetical protein